jgi:hypothetical protein
MLNDEMAASGLQFPTWRHADLHRTLGSRVIAQRPIRSMRTEQGNLPGQAQVLNHSVAATDQFLGVKPDLGRIKSGSDQGLRELVAGEPSDPAGHPSGIVDGHVPKGGGLFEQPKVRDAEGKGHFARPLNLRREGKGPSELIGRITPALSESCGFAQSIAQVGEETEPFSLAILVAYLETGIFEAGIRPAKPGGEQPGTTEFTAVFVS